MSKGKVTNMSRVSISAIAIKANVSVSTVSRALNGDTRIREEVKEKIRQIAGELGYIRRPPSRRPGPRFQGRHCPQLIPIALVTGYGRAALASPIYARTLRALGDAAIDLGFTLEIVVNEELLGGTLEPGRHSGAFILGPVPQAALPFDIPCVRIFASPVRDVSWDWVTYDDDLVGRIAARELHRRGYSQAVVLTPPHGYAPWSRVESFQKEAAMLGLNSRVFAREFLIRNQCWQHTSMLAFDELAAFMMEEGLSNPAFFSTHDALLPALAAFIRRIDHVDCQPNRIVSVNHEREFLDAMIDPPASIELHPERIGRWAAEVLMRRIKEPETSRMTMIIDPTLMQVTLRRRKMEL
jgi:LacI family transcriptional regulator